MGEKRIAVILTVFNRCETTLLGLQTLYTAIKDLGKPYAFDVYMTDDGSTDGTSLAVKKDFPLVNIIEGNGTLYWGGGMRRAWKAALDSGIQYDYFLWYNDDSELFSNALKIMFDEVPDNSIITGAFCDHSNKASYGGKVDDGHVMEPNGDLQDVNLMNGNLVLIPHNVYASIGMIDKHMIHGGGDYDYGYRAKKNGFRVLLSRLYVGISDRHDCFIPNCYSPHLSFIKRWELLHSPMYSPYKRLHYSLAYCGFKSTLISFVVSYIGVFSPSTYSKIKNKYNKK